jgi:S1-C subfamily serine protease
LTGLGLASVTAVLWADGLKVDPRVWAAEKERIALVGRVTPSVVAIFAQGGQGGGSGVLISSDGYALSNFHVVEGCGPVMQCGLPDGHLYDAVLVGLDRVGDVALIKLLPKRHDQQFPAAVLGDSDQLRTGDWSLVLGNPFLLATDFQPTATYGLVSGVHRYQYPAGTILEYTDCIQVDASINPGNSGGPLFNASGELVGINGRGSFEKRGRVNTGVGYAISINQIKNFLGHLRGGLDTDHATLGAEVRSDSDDESGSGSRLVVSAIVEGCDAQRRGLDTDDEIVSFAGRPMTSVNQYKNVLGLFPKGWRVPLVYRRNNEKHEILVRLMQLLPSESGNEAGKPKGPPAPARRPPAPPNSPAMKLYEPRRGFANYYFNRIERDRLLADFKSLGDFSTVAGAWEIVGEGELKQGKSDLQATIRDEASSTGSTRTLVVSALGHAHFQLDPLKIDPEAHSLKDPPGSGGLLMALYQYRRLLTHGTAGFEQYCYYGGYEPFYPPPVDNRKSPGINDWRVDTEVLLTEHAAVPAKWYFSRKDHALLGFEITASAEEDPCEVYLSDYRPVEGRPMPYRIEVRHGNDRFGIFKITNYRLAGSSSTARREP